MNLSIPGKSKMPPMLQLQEQRHIQLLAEAERTRFVSFVVCLLVWPSVLSAPFFQIAIGTIIVGTLSLMLAILVVPFLFLQIQFIQMESQACLYG